MDKFGANIKIENIGLRSDGQPYFKADFAKGGRVGDSVGISFYQFDYLVMANKIATHQGDRKKGVTLDADSVSTLVAKVSFDRKGFGDFVKEINALWGQLNNDV